MELKEKLKGKSDREIADIFWFLYGYFQTGEDKSFFSAIRWFLNNLEEKKEIQDA